jgi:hypothetical protein
VPAGQVVQADWPVVLEKVPVGQERQVALPAFGWNDPAGQGAQNVPAS